MDKAHKITDDEIENIIKHLSVIYAILQKKIQNTLSDLFEKFNERAMELLSNYNNAETNVERQKAKREYIKFFRNEVLKSRYFKDVSSEIALDIYNSNIEATKYINSKAPKIYSINYNYFNSEIQKNVPDFVYENVTEKEVEKYAKLEKETVSKSKDTKWNENNIKKSIIGGALLMLGTNQIIRRTSKTVTKKNRNFADTHASGVGTYSENRARMDSMYRANDMGIKTEKQWRATLDNLTRDSHRHLDGATIPLNERFDNGLLQPRDPNGEYSEICNCRCRLRFVIPNYTEYSTRTARQGEVTGSQYKSSSWKNTRTIEIENMSYGEYMRWKQRNG